MAFAVRIDIEHCTGCNNCVVAYPADGLELHTVDLSSKDKIYKAMTENPSFLTSMVRSAPEAALESRHVHAMLSDWQAPGNPDQRQRYNKGTA